jgi:hypothetical protein
MFIYLKRKISLFFIRKIRFNSIQFNFILIIIIILETKNENIRSLTIYKTIKYINILIKFSKRFNYYLIFFYSPRHTHTIKKNK